MIQDFSVVVVSCDNYSDAWEPFFTCYSKFWNSSKHKVFLINNMLSFQQNNAIVINTGPEISWSRKVRTALRAIDSEYLLLMLEDYFLVESVDAVSGGQDRAVL